MTFFRFRRNVPRYGFETEATIAVDPPLRNPLRLNSMPWPNQDAMAAIQPELTSGESIVWSGRPNVSVVFHKDDFLLIPFSLLWGGFAIFWEAGVAGLWTFNGHRGTSWSFGMIWGIPFVLIGQYLIWGRFLYAAWLKARTYYAVTTRRVMVVQEGWKRQTASAFIDSLPTLIKEGSSRGVGSLRFAPSQPMMSGKTGWGAWNGMRVGDLPMFMDIEDVDSVYRLVSDLREKSRTPKTTF
jgi:hypothetical protein